MRGAFGVGQVGVERLFKSGVCEVDFGGKSGNVGEDFGAGAGAGI